MLSEREQSIVNQNKEWGFGAYLQWAWFEYPSLQEEIAAGQYPSRERLNNGNKRMDRERKGFDVCYLLELPHEEINPLKVETDAWGLLSPRVRRHVDEFGGYIANYSPRTAEQQPLLTQVGVSWDLLQKWNVVSQSYKAKYEQNWDRVAEREDAVRKLIHQLQEQQQV